MDSTGKVVKGTLRTRYWTLNGPQTLAAATERER